ncbi:cyclic GMP-AMP synthase DncV-like nucleotidyltransferase [Promicromonospora sukumoe]|uniref:SMODS domain-containing nucleotidyltransferase n=1 Tax=Promicromonospora sukumoe TaxID=88382 RepID=UPI003647E592
MQLISYFNEFLRTTVDLNSTRLESLDERVGSIFRVLQGDEVLGERVVEKIPQGSWAHRTIIKPFNNHEYDADVLVQIKEQEAWEPREYIRTVRAALRNSSTYRDKVRKKNRCVRVGYANDCHIDVVPYVELSDGRKVVAKYSDSTFEETNPEGFTAWMRERDELANRNLRKVLRLLKYLRDYKQTFTAPSIILTLLVAERVSGWDAAERYKDVPTTLKTLINDLNTWLAWYPTMPPLDDPSAPGTTFNHRWTDDQYENFRNRIALYADWITEAYDETDKQKSIVAWQRIFGPAFKAPSRSLTAAVASSGEVRPLLERAPNEQFIEERGFEPVLSHRARIDCMVEKKAGFRSGPLRAFRSIGVGRSLYFTVQTDVAVPYDLYWKVRNTGKEAAHQLRGQIVEDTGSMSRTEPTRFRGRHYVEAYVVKDGKVLAMDRHDVVIR